VGRDQPERRRACLYATIEAMIAAEPQGFLPGIVERDANVLLERDANVSRLCELANVSRAGFYRRRAPNPPAQEDADLRDLIQRIALKDRHYGYRRIAAELRRHGLIVNAKRVLRLMRADNLLSLRANPFIPRTTMSRHDQTIVPNLARKLVPTGLDQLWVADITYVRLAENFVYLAVVLDAFSRRVIGWALDDHLEASLAIEALDKALEARNPQPDTLIHHSDRGVQYACTAYAERLDERRILASMSRPGNPYDNAKAESFMKTLKTEEVDAKTYANLDQARIQIGAFIANVYNTRRLHSALGYKPPVEFEANHVQKSKTHNRNALMI
jgi:putative transposase